MRKTFQEFSDFVREQGVIGLAVGLAIGTQAGAAVSAIVHNFINPLVGFLLGGNNLGEMSWDTGLNRGGKELVFGWGSIASALITLLATAFVIYFIVVKAGLTKIDKKKEK